MKIVYESSNKIQPSYGDTLMHWKYIKRERKNGRWVYYYNDSEYQEAKKKYDAYKKGYDIAQMRKAAADADYQVNQEIYEKNGHAPATKKYLRENAANAYENNKRYVLAEKKYVQAKKEYQTTKIKTLLPRTIAKGAVKVANLLSKITSKKNKKNKKALITSSSSLMLNK